MGDEIQAVRAGSRTSQLLGWLGIYATYVAAAVLTLVIIGDLAVLVGHVRVTGWLGPLLGLGPVVALQLSTLASYINYYGVWRVARHKDEYDAGQDLKSHAADIPQAAQALLAGRAGCLPFASVALLLCSLLALGVAAAPPATPFVGPLGALSRSLGVVGFDAPPTGPAPTATSAVALVTATPPAAATASATTASGPTATPQPGSTATATPVPVIAFTISPTTATYDCNAGAIVPPASVTLDNTKSNMPVTWKVTGIMTVTNSVGATVPWATLSPSSGSVVAGGVEAIKLVPYSADSTICQSSNALNLGGRRWSVTISPTDAPNQAQTFTYTVYGYILG